jgi:hypothetical protein
MSCYLTSKWSSAPRCYQLTTDPCSLIRRWDVSWIDSENYQWKFKSLARTPAWLAGEPLASSAFSGSNFKSKSLFLAQEPKINSFPLVKFYQPLKLQLKLLSLPPSLLFHLLQASQPVPSWLFNLPSPCFSTEEITQDQRGAGQSGACL